MSYAIIGLGKIGTAIAQAFARGDRSHRGRQAAAGRARGADRPVARSPAN